MTIACPYCNERAALQHVRMVWIVGDVAEIDLETGACLVTERDKETDQESGKYLCSNCCEEFSEQEVLDLIAGGDIE